MANYLQSHIYRFNIEHFKSNQLTASRITLVGIWNKLN
jgi:hypothetical protein